MNREYLGLGSESPRDGQVRELVGLGFELGIGLQLVTAVGAELGRRLFSNSERSRVSSSPRHPGAGGAMGQNPGRPGDCSIDAWVAAAASVCGHLPRQQLHQRRIDPGLQTGLQLWKHPFPVASTEVPVTRHNARLLLVAVRIFRSFFALVMRGAVDRMLSNLGPHTWCQATDEFSALALAWTSTWLGDC
jgi:hypothetical protein